MELKQEFKQTEAGVIPIDWDVTTFDMIADKRKKWSITGGPFGSNLKVSDYTDSGVQIVQLQNIGDGIFKDDYQIYTSEEKADELLSCNIYPNEIIISKMGDPVARACFIPNKAKRYLMASDGIRLVVNEKVFSKKFIHDYINSDYFRKRAFENSRGSTRLRIGLPELKSLAVIKPKLAEQNAIASALSNIDDLISQTEKLIDKKKAIKQGVMQELLILKDGWVTKRISEVCWFQEGPGVRKHQFTQSGVKLLNGTNIQEGKLDLENTDKFISEEEAFGWYSHFLVDDNDILIACSGVSIDKFHEKVTVAKVFHLPLCMNTSTMRFKVKKGYLDQGYFIQFLKSKRFKEQISGKATGSAQLNFGPSHVTMVEIDLPGIEIQNKIGEVLSDMEMEIENFELKLKKLIFQKQGMMQALLTGKIRLL